MAAKNETKKVAENGTASMAEDSTTKQESAMAGTTAEKKPGDKESVYTIDEFCSNAQKLFNTRPECVRAAFVEKGVAQCKKAEAGKIIEAFIKKEVK